MYSFDVLAGSEAATWRADRSFIDHALYYLTGPGGSLLLGHQLWPLLLIAGICTYLVFKRPSLAPWRFCALRIAILCIAAFAVPTILPTKIAQFAATFHALFWLAAALALVVCICRESARTQLLAIAGVLAALALTGSLAHSPSLQPSGSATTHSRSASQSDSQAISTAAFKRAAIRSEAMAILGADLVSRARLRSHTPVRALILAGPGDICPEYVWHLRHQSGVNLLATHILDPTLDASINQELDRAALVVCTDGQTPLTVARRTAPNANERLAQHVKSDTRFRMVRTLRVGRGAWMIYERPD